MEALDDDTRNAVYGEYFAVGQTPGVVGGEQLHPTHTATTVRVEDGRTLTTDGPFADTKEFLGGAVAGLYPASRAARLAPADAVRPA